MGGETPEICWAVNKRQDNKLENCCIWLVIYLNCTMMHGLTLNFSVLNYVLIFNWEYTARFVYLHIRIMVFWVMKMHFMIGLLFPLSGQKWGWSFRSNMLLPFPKVKRRRNCQSDEPHSYSDCSLKMKLSEELTASIFRMYPKD